MARKSNAMIATQAAAVRTVDETVDLAPALRDVVTEIGTLLDDVQTASVTAYWNIGRLITEVEGDPDKYLTAEQKAQHVNPGSLVISIFSQAAYSPDQLRGAVAFFDKYPSEHQLSRLLEMRCPDRPRWRLTASHVQMLSQVADDDQRAALEEKCAEEAYTARALANELQELRGKRPGGGRKHQAPKGLKQQVHDLLQYQRKFIGRSESLWLNEDDETLYDALINSSPSKRDETVLGYFQEVVENFTKLSDLVGDHIAMCNRVLEHLQSESADDEQEDSEETEENASSAARSAAAAAAAAGRRRTRNITR